MEASADQVMARAPSAASRLAVLSFASGLVCCCPGTSLLACLAGGVALILGLRQSGDDLSWRKFAYGGIVMGLVSLVVLSVLYSMASSRWEQEWRLLLTGPNNALFELQEGSRVGFRSEFTGPALESSDSEVDLLAGRIREELGVFVRARSTRTTPPEFDGPPPWELGEYELQFNDPEVPDWSGVLDGRIGIDRLPSGTLRLTWILLEGTGPDGTHVRMRFPTGTNAEPETE